MNTPSITPASVGAALILGLTNVEILLGTGLSPSKEKALDTLINGLAVLGFLAHDAIVRRSRAQNADKIAAAAVAVASAPAQGAN